jgi:TPR repeat protein
MKTTVATAMVMVLGLVSGCAARDGGSAKAATVAAKIEAPAENPIPAFVDPTKVDALGEAASSHFAGTCSSASSVQLDAATTSLYGKACRRNDADGCMKLAAAYMCGNGVMKNDATAVSLLEQGCAADAKRCNVLGAALIEGRMTRRDLGRAFTLYEKGCEAGSPAVCTAYGSLLLVAGRPSEHSRAIAALEKACNAEESDADACANLAIAHLDGIGFEKDAVKATELGKRACEAKSALGCAIYANALMTGKGATQDVEAGAKLFAIACDGGSNAACVATGKCLYYGVGVTRDTEKASTVLVAACDKGSGEACRLLADWSLAGRTAPPPTGLNPVMF